jgi:hypothetical protein
MICGEVGSLSLYSGKFDFRKNENGDRFAERYGEKLSLWWMDCEDYLVSNLTVLLFAERLAKLQSVFIFKLQ